MKKILIWMSPVLFLLFIQLSCARKTTPTVAKNVDLSADFKKIESYSWAIDIDNIPNDHQGLIAIRQSSGSTLCSSRTPKAGFTYL